MTNPSKSNRRGFTLMEMMIALVVGAMLMTSLVGISASVQRTFGRSAEVTELQANLRFAMKTLVQDISRSAFMYSPDLSNDLCHLSGQPITGNPPAMAFTQDATEVELTLRGNFASSRDYLLNLSVSPFKVVCRNQQDWSTGGRCSLDPDAEDETPRHERYLQPFGDGPKMDTIFPSNSWVRIEVDNRRYAYYQVASVDAANFTITFTNDINRNTIRGNYRWVSPVSELRWRLQEDGAYTPSFGAPGGDNGRWVLMRQFIDANGAIDREVEVADFLLPQARGGLEFQVINDSAANLCMRAAAPNLQPSTDLLSGAANPVQARALRVTMRGRTESEDPEFTVADYNGTLPDVLDKAMDCDGDPANGLAPVVTESTVINLRNLSLNQSF